MIMRRLAISIALLCLTPAILSASTAASASTDRSARPRTTTRLAASGPDAVKHVVVIVEQGHTYDSYFGAYPRGDGAFSGGARVAQATVAGASVAGASVASRAIRPDDFARFKPADNTTALANTSGAALAAYHGGAMDSFVRAQERRGKPQQLPMLHADGSSASGLWAIADNYVLFDKYFSSVPGGSVPNMISLFSGVRKGYATTGNTKNLSRFAKSDTPTMFDQLTERKLPWRYYAGSLPLLDGDRVLDGSYLQEGKTPSALFASPVLAMPRFWRQPMRANLATQDQFYKDATSGNLPAVSVVSPAPSDQPLNSLESSQQRLLSLINTMTKGPDWSSTAVFVVWDDWGGWYDHVVPPTTGGLLGFRVPALLVSPLVRKGYVSSVPQDHRSVLAFIARRFGLPDLTNGEVKGATFDAAFENPPPLDARGVVRLTRLPAPPVGTDRQNALALATYAMIVGAATLAAVAWAMDNRRRRRMHPELADSR